MGSLLPQQVLDLKSFKCVDDVEDAGMDEGRFFVHLIAPYSWVSHGIQHTKSFGSFFDAVRELKKFK